jgi:hypothetical protein
MNRKSPGKMRWKEPTAFRRSQFRPTDQSYRWYRPLFLLAICVLGFGGVAFHRNPVGGSWPLTAAVIIGTGFLIAYGLPFIAMIDPNVVFIGERGIGRQSNMGSGVRLECWEWQDIARCDLGTREIEGRSFRILLIHLADAEPIELALGERVNVTELESVLAVRGCELYRTA